MSYTNPDYVAANRNGALTEEQKKSTYGALVGTAFGTGCLVLVGMFFFVIVFGSLSIPVFERIDPSGALGLLCAAALAATLGVAWLAMTARNYWLTHGDITNQRIARAQGELVWQRNKYAFQTNDSQKLQLTEAAPPPTFVYQAYYLEQSRRLLSLEALAESVTGEATLREALQRTFKFDDTMLTENRQGRLTTAQRKRLVTAAAVLAAVCGLIALGLLAALLLVVTRSTGDILVGVAIMGIFAAIMGGIAVFQLREAINVAGLSEQAVSEVTGVGTKYSRTTGSGKSRRTVYYCQINSRAFTVNTAAFEAFIQGMNYRAYFVEKPYTLLSLEVV